MAGEIGYYANADKVRALVGVTDNEIDDAALLNMELDRTLLADLYPWLPDHKAYWDAGAASGATDEAKHIRNLIGIYACRFCALEVLSSPLHIPQQVSNGKDSAKRFAFEAWEAAAAALKEKLGLVKTELQDIISPPISASPGFFTRAAPNSDPVAGT